MGKKKRKSKITVYGIVEGVREKCFLKFLTEIYRPRENNINITFPEPSGGTPDKLIGMALKNKHFDRVFVWLDEDFEPEYPLSEELRQRLKIEWDQSNIDDFLSCPLKTLDVTYNVSKKKPRLIVSQPVSVESIILKVLNRTLPYLTYEPKKKKEQIKKLKSTLSGILGQIDEVEFYRNNLTKEILEKRRKEVTELDILIKMITL